MIKRLSQKWPKNGDTEFPKKAGFSKSPKSSILQAGVKSCWQHKQPIPQFRGSLGIISGN